MYTFNNSYLLKLSSEKQFLTMISKVSERLSKGQFGTENVYSDLTKPTTLVLLRKYLLNILLCCKYVGNPKCCYTFKDSNLGKFQQI